MFNLVIQPKHQLLLYQQVSRLVVLCFLHLILLVLRLRFPRGTIFEKTRTPISKWICAIALFKIGISANQLKDEIRVTYKAAWQMLSKIRKAIKRDPLTDQLSGHIEVDETYFG